MSIQSERDFDTLYDVSLPEHPYPGLRPFRQDEWTIFFGRESIIDDVTGKLKRFKRIALRCEKTKRNFASFVALAAGFILIKSVHTA